MRMDVSDEILVSLAKGGDGTAFGHLLARHYDLIFRLGFRMLGQKAEAEDLAQDICAALPAKMAGFRGDAKFSTWLYRVTLNAAKDRLRKRSRRQAARKGWGDTARLALEADAHARGERDWLASAMKTLSDDLRETLALTLGEDMTHGQAAEVLGVSEGTVSWRMSEVKKALRALAKEEERIS
jgi:RNA polymerase sigma-70 factor, ECF subfamily